MQIDTDTHSLTWSNWHHLNPVWGHKRLSSAFSHTQEQSPRLVKRLWCVKSVVPLNKRWGCLHSNTGVRGRGISPCPLSRNSVMMAALQGDQGLVRLIWMRVGDIMWLSCSFPNTSSQAFTLSCGMLNTCPVERERDARCLSVMHGYLYLCSYAFRLQETLQY